MTKEQIEEILLKNSKPMGLGNLVLIPEAAAAIHEAMMKERKETPAVRCFLEDQWDERSEMIDDDIDSLHRVAGLTVLNRVEYGNIIEHLLIFLKDQNKTT